MKEGTRWEGKEMERNRKGWLEKRGKERRISRKKALLTLLIYNSIGDMNIEITVREGRMKERSNVRVR